MAEDIWRRIFHPHNFCWLDKYCRHEKKRKIESFEIVLYHRKESHGYRRLLSFFLAVHKLSPATKTFDAFFFELRIGVVDIYGESKIIQIAADDRIDCN